MLRKLCWFGTAFGAAVLLVAVGQHGRFVPAQARKVEPPPTAGRGADVAPERRERPPAPTVREALDRPFFFPFDKPTPLKNVCKHLGRMLNASVVLDLAALDRQEVLPEDTVELELEGVRLKTGLGLLLGQLDLTYKVVPEDNLLIITDARNGDDPLRRVEDELKTIHRELHDLRDAVDRLREPGQTLDEEADAARLRKPTIIEEMPDGAASGPEKNRNEEKKAAPAPSKPKTSVRHRS